MEETFLSLYVDILEYRLEADPEFFDISFREREGLFALDSGLV